MPTLVLVSIAASCEPRDEPGANSRDGSAGREPISDSAVIANSASRWQPVAPDIATEPLPPDFAVSAPDTASFVTHVELGDLGATLDVPVQGVTRLQLRDTYTEPRAGHVHEALDIPAARGTPVLSATDGRLLKLFNSKAGGLMVYATDKSERFILLYGHLDSYAEGLSDGMRLERGQVIGYVGTTGNAPPGTPHLHFGILRGEPKASWSKGVPVNPYPLLMR
jgi:murein DD-endopeptidase MepM/ murein hydrolase activator NlpD